MFVFLSLLWGFIETAKQVTSEKGEVRPTFIRHVWHSSSILGITLEVNIEVSCVINGRIAFISGLHNSAQIMAIRRGEVASKPQGRGSYQEACKIGFFSFHAGPNPVSLRTFIS